MKKNYLLASLLIISTLTIQAQTPELIFGNTTGLTVINYNPVINVVQYGSGITSHAFDLDGNGSPDINLVIDRKLSIQYEAAYVTFINPDAAIALNSLDSLTVIAFKQGDSLFVDDYSFVFNADAFDGALLYGSSGTNSYGQFSINAFRYMGFRMQNATDTTFGWLRMARAAAFSTDSLSFVVDQLVFQGELSGISQVQQTENINVYPTITDDAVFIDRKNTSPSQIMLYSISGQLIHRENLNTQQNVLHLNNYLPGMYLLKITSSQGQQTFKIVKE